ncbi:MAG: NAD-dependent succinate-semialdehyde dehydrogenase [Cyclobacteriaceae bacterium]
MQISNFKLFQTGAFINGVFLESASIFAVTNPYDNRTIAKVMNCSSSETTNAIAAAQAAFPEWSGKTAKERSKLLMKWYTLIMEHQEELASILTMEMGKPLSEAKGEIAYGASFIEWFSEEAKRVYGDTIPGHQADKRILVLKQPIGVVGAITPWNFPNAMITRKIAPAIAVGCTVVIKPAELTPLSALALCVLANEAGIPPGVINVIPTHRPAEVGQVLTSHPAVKKISFTGSTEVGKLLLEQSASTVKKVTLELGGNAPFIVFDDADIDAAVEGAIISKYRNAGQTCVCTNRFFAQAEIHDEFVEKFTKAVASQKIGNGMDQDVTIGPLIEEKAVQSIEKLIENAIHSGAKVTTGGKRISDSLMFEPTVLTSVTHEMALNNTEIFGPVAPITKFTSEDQVISMANDTPYGLAAYFYGSDHARIWRTAEALQYGMVGINTGLISTEVAPFGGVKESGFGREGSKYGVDDYLEIKYLCWGGIS